MWDCTEEREAQGLLSFRALQCQEYQVRGGSEAWEDTGLKCSPSKCYQWDQSSHQRSRLNRKLTFKLHAILIHVHESCPLKQTKWTSIGIVQTGWSIPQGSSFPIKKKKLGHLCAEDCCAKVVYTVLRYCFMDCLTTEQMEKARLINLISIFTVWHIKSMRFFTYCNSCPVTMFCFILINSSESTVPFIYSFL